MPMDIKLFATLNAQIEQAAINIQSVVQQINNITNNLTQTVNNITNITNQITEVKNDIAFETVDTVLDKDDWVGDSAPFSITFNVAGVDPETYVDLVLPGSGVTKAIVEAYQNAMIVNGSQGDGTITLYAWGDKPEIDLPIEAVLKSRIAENGGD